MPKPSAATANPRAIASPLRSLGNGSSRVVSGSLLRAALVGDGRTVGTASVVSAGTADRVGTADSLRPVASAGEGVGDFGLGVADVGAGAAERDGDAAAVGRALVGAGVGRGDTGVGDALVGLGLGAVITMVPLMLDP